MSGRLLALCVFSSIFALVCLYLGFWQLGRNAERGPLAEVYARTFAAAPVSLGDAGRLTSDSGNARVIVAGRYDFAHEIVLANRSRNGAPGVVIITPLLRADNDTAVLVSRGWVYSADGASVRLANWRAGIERGDSLARTSTQQSLLGLALRLPDSTDARLLTGDSSGAVARISRLSRNVIAPALPYPVASMYVQLLSVDTVIRTGVPVPLAAPKPTAGPHLSYAVQWFAFAAIAIFGTWVVVGQARKK